MKSAITWGVLKKFIDDKDVHEIIIDRAEDCMIGIKNEIKKGPKFKQIELNKLAQQILKNAHDPKSLSAEVLLPNNILVRVIMPPIAPDGPFLRIWKKPNQEVTIDHLLKWDFMTKKQADYLNNLLKTDQSIIVAGSLGSGRTTFLNTLINLVPESYHVVTIEQYAELNGDRPRTVRLVASQNKAHEMVELVEMASRSRGDCLVLSSIHGPEVLPFIELLRDGSQGMLSMTGENVFDVMKRLEYKISANAPWMTLDDIRYGITKAFGHILFQDKLSDGKRKLTHLARLLFVDGEIKIEEV
jgi:pilus assembly protein CpaF